MDKILLLTEKEFQGIIQKIVNDTIAKIPQKPNKDLLSYKEAAAFLDIKESTLSRQVNDGLYKKHLSASGKPYVSRKEILAGFN